MSFAGKVWRLLVGIKDALSLCFLLLFFSLLFAALSMRPNPALVREGALLLDLNGSVVEEVTPIDPFAVLTSGALPSREYAARDLIHAIDSAAGDDRIKAIALDLSTFLGGGQVHMQAIGEALDRFRATEKPVLAYAVAYTDDSLLLAAHASEVWLDPMGGAVIAGPGGERMYYAGLFDRLNINAHIFRVGTFKSAVEPYMRADMSPEARENAQAYYGALWDGWRADIRRARPEADIDRVVGDTDAWIAESGGDLAEAALAAGLADRIGTRAEWGDRIAQIAGEEEFDETPGAFAHTEYDPWLAEVGTRPAMRGLGGGPAAIGVVTIAGEISDGDAGPGEAGAERIVGLLDDALDDGFEALVVRVNSPGGTVTGSEAIRRAILRHKAGGIPIVVSMGNVAASGGYWVSTPADRIFAEPETITGSIGIFGWLPTFEGLLSDWGVNTDGVRTTPFSGQPDLAAGLTPETERLLQASIEEGYTDFIGLVAQSRSITVERADELAQGRVWSGGDARQMGLVDEFGGLDDAIAFAARQAQLEDGGWQPVYLQAQDSNPVRAFLSGLMQSHARATTPASARTGQDVMAILARRESERMSRAIAEIDGLLGTSGMQARCLECPAEASTSGRHGGAGGGLEGALGALLRGWLD